MVTVLRAEGLRVVIFVNDHQPAHVHVFGDGEAKINLTGAGGTPELIWADRMTRGEVRQLCGSLPRRGRRYWRDGRVFMAELTDAQIDTALQRGKVAASNEPRAASARYDS